MAMKVYMWKELVPEALNMVLWQRHPSDVIRDCDQ
jgi:hypothetical protein